MEWKLSDREQQNEWDLYKEKRGKISESRRKRIIPAVAKQLALGSTLFDLRQLGNRNFLLLRDSEEYTKLREFGAVGFPPKARTFRDCLKLAGWRTCRGAAKQKYTKELCAGDFEAAKALCQPKEDARGVKSPAEFPNGVCFFAQSKLAYEMLMKAITDAKNCPKEPDPTGADPARLIRAPHSAVRPLVDARKAKTGGKKGKKADTGTKETGPSRKRRRIVESESEDSQDSGSSSEEEEESSSGDEDSEVEVIGNRMNEVDKRGEVPVAAKEKGRQRRARFPSVVNNPEPIIRANNTPPPVENPPIRMPELRRLSSRLKEADLHAAIEKIYTDYRASRQGDEETIDSLRDENQAEIEVATTYIRLGEEIIAEGRREHAQATAAMEETRIKRQKIQAMIDQYARKIQQWTQDLDRLNKDDDDNTDQQIQSDLEIGRGNSSVKRGREKMEATSEQSAFIREVEEETRREASRVLQKRLAEHKSKSSKANWPARA